MMGDAAGEGMVGLGRQLVSNDAEQRVAAAELLSRAGEQAAVVAVPLVTACGDADDRVRELAVAALEDLGPPPTESVAPLSRLVTASDPLTAYWATTLLGRLGGDAAAAVPVLAACIESSADLSVRQRAAWAIGKIGPAATSARVALQKAASQGDERLARLATEALGLIGS